jgi:acetyl esterase
MPEHAMRADVRAYLMAANRRPTFTSELLAQIRKMPADAMAGLDLTVGDLGEVRDLAMPGPAGDIALRLFDARSEREPGPAIVFYHGGSFCLGSIETHAGLAAEIARQLDLPVISVDYRLAPEHAWPAAPDDCEAAARWIADNDLAFGRVLTGLVLCGDSAGGNLAIVTALALRDRPACLPLLAQLLFYPIADFRGDYESRRTFSEGYGPDSASMAMFDAHYAPDPANWRASPLLADQTGMPPTLVATASLDLLRDEGRAYAAKTILAGVPTAYLEAEGTIHGFVTYRHVVPSAQGDLAAILDAAEVTIRQGFSLQSQRG